MKMNWVKCGRVGHRFLNRCADSLGGEMSLHVPMNEGAFIICCPIARTAPTAVSCDDAANRASRSRISDASRSRISDISGSVGSSHRVG